MPFKSEKQRRYLWANEPEIARDWTDTYGSKIHKADGGRIGLRNGSPHDNTAPSRSTGSHSRSYNPGAGGVVDHSPRSRTDRSRIQRDRQADFKANPKNYITQDRGGNLPNRTGILGNTIHNISNFYRNNIYDRRPYDLKQRQKFLAKKGLYNLDPVLDEDEYGDPRYSDSDWLTSQEGLEHLWGLGYTGGKINPADDRGQGLPYIYPYETASVPIEEEEIVETDPINLYAGSYRVRPEYLLAEGGRVPAAYGGIMDTYTGRRKYGFGSFISKPFKAAKKAVKKLTSSPIGKLALLYAAGTYLGGTQALSGQMGGAGTFAQRLKDPKLLANLINAEGTWGTATKNLPVDWADKATRLAGDKVSLWDKGIKALKNPWVTIPAASAATGLLTAQQPEEDLDSVQGDYDDELAKWEEILAPYKGKYRVQDEYLVAEGGRIGYANGGDWDADWDDVIDPSDPDQPDPDWQPDWDDYLDVKKKKKKKKKRAKAQEGGLMDLGGMEKDYRNDGGFVPIGGQEKADDVPARLSRNEFVFTADAVRSAGGGDIDKGAEVMENVMKNLEAGGKVSEESQGKGGAQEMFEVSERLSEVM